MKKIILTILTAIVFLAALVTGIMSIFNNVTVPGLTPFLVVALMGLALAMTYQRNKENKIHNYHIYIILFSAAGILNLVTGIIQLYQAGILKLTQ